MFPPFGVYLYIKRFFGGKKMKKLIAVVLIIMLFSTLAGCSMFDAHYSDTAYAEIAVVGVGSYSAEAYDSLTYALEQQDDIVISNEDSVVRVVFKCTACNNSVEAELTGATAKMFYCKCEEPSYFAVATHIKKEQPTTN